MMSSIMFSSRVHSILIYYLPSDLSVGKTLSQLNYIGQILILLHSIYDRLLVNFIEIELVRIYPHDSLVNSIIMINEILIKFKTCSSLAKVERVQ